MEDRLVPINALLGLVLPNDVNMPALAHAGFYLVGLEVPVTVAPGMSVTIDAVLLHTTTSHLVQVETKSGPNIEVDQAVKYGKVSPQTLVQAGYVNLPVRTRPTIETLYVCLMEHMERVRLGLATAGLTYPILAVSDTAVALDLAQPASSQLREAFPQERISLIGRPPRMIYFDQDSHPEMIRSRVLAELVATMAHRTPQISLANLAERATPHYPLYGRAAQGRIRRKVGDVARVLCREMSDSLMFVPPVGNHDGLVRILRTPEDNDNRGRTQAYQALGRVGRGRRRAQLTRVSPDQLDLLSELDSVDNDGDESADDVTTDDPGEGEP